MEEKFYCTLSQVKWAFNLRIIKKFNPKILIDDMIDALNEVKGITIIPEVVSIHDDGRVLSSISVCTKKGFVAFDSYDYEKIGRQAIDYALKHATD